MSLRSLLFDATVENIHHSLQRHMPVSQQQEFYLWGISSQNLQRDLFLQTMGVPQMLHLSANLLGDLVDEADWGKLARYCGRINAYFMYEIVSDDLAMGLSPLAADDRIIPLRREVLYTFNYVMVERLSGEPTSSAKMLEALIPYTERISGFKQSMGGDKRHTILRVYRQQRQDVAPSDIEYAIWPVLVANIESCYDLVASMAQLQIGPIFQQGSVNRYRAVTQLLESGGSVPLADLVDMGTHTVSVIPALSYSSGCWRR